MRKEKKSEEVEFEEGKGILINKVVDKEKEGKYD